jgi:hypothetical protein
VKSAIKRIRYIFWTRDRLDREIINLTQKLAKTKWEGWFDTALHAMVDEDTTAQQSNSVCTRAAAIADAALAQYEDRWGKGSR